MWPISGYQLLRNRIHALFPQYFNLLSDVGLAMIKCALTGSEKKVPGNCPQEHDTLLVTCSFAQQTWRPDGAPETVID
jgi:hypothetical protein